MGYSGFYGVETPTVKHPMHAECGIVAIGSLIDTEPYKVWDRLVEKDKSLAEYILAKHAQGLDYMDIINIVKGIGSDLSADLRLNSLRRDMTGQIFQSGDLGVVAMKFKGTNNTHWAKLEKGIVSLGGGVWFRTMEQLKEKISSFDGIGHVLIFRTPGEVESLRNTYAIKCSCELCSNCCRKKACADQVKL